MFQYLILGIFFLYTVRNKLINLWYEQHKKCIEKQINVITQGVLKDAKDVREKINKVNKKRNSVIVPENQ